MSCQCMEVNEIRLLKDSFTSKTSLQTYRMSRQTFSLLLLKTKSFFNCALWMLDRENKSIRREEILRSQRRWEMERLFWSLCRPPCFTVVAKQTADDKQCVPAVSRLLMNRRGPQQQQRLCVCVCVCVCARLLHSWWGVPSCCLWVCVAISGNIYYYATLTKPM